MSKYGNKKTKIKGLNFDSKKEASRYFELTMFEKQGIIKDLELQKKFELQPKYKKIGKTIRAINYIADFVYFDNEKKKIIIEDVKAFNKKTGKFLSTADFKIKKKIFEFKYPELEIILI